MSRHLNIVSFDVPFPANYGGVIDVFYKLYWLKKAGVKIHLHCFAYGRPAAKELEELCEEVFYYKRQTGLLSNLSVLPYNVQSRRSVELENNLLKNDYPILFEVLHTSSLMSDKRFKDRKKIYRHSNIEHDYYTGLAKSEKDILKKLYLRIEAIKLEWFEKTLLFADLILAVNRKDTDYFKVKFPKVKTVFLPSFHAYSDSLELAAKSNFILFQGNLSVSENLQAVSWLIENVFSKITLPVVIAGLNPPKRLSEEVLKFSNIQLIASPDDEHMQNLIATAKIQVLYTEQATGLKLKLLNVLFKGGFVVCNAAMLEGTGFSENSSLKVKETGAEYIDAITVFYGIQYTQELVKERELQLTEFKNENTVKKLIETVFEEG